MILLDPHIVDWSDQLLDHRDDIKAFIEAHLDIFPKAKQIRKNDWSSYDQIMADKGIQTHHMFGKCFHSAKFAHAFAGGKQYADLMLMKPFVFDQRVPELTTTHWFVRVRKPTIVDPIVDPSEDQFIPHDWESFVDMRSQHTKRGEFGNPYFGKKGWYKFGYYDEKNKVQTMNVPNDTTFALADQWKAEFGWEIEPIEQWRIIKEHMC